MGILFTTSLSPVVRKQNQHSSNICVETGEQDSPVPLSNFPSPLSPNIQAFLFGLALPPAYFANPQHFYLCFPSKPPPPRILFFNIPMLIRSRCFLRASLMAAWSLPKMTGVSPRHKPSSIISIFSPTEFVWSLDGGSVFDRF